MNQTPTYINPILIDNSFIEPFKVGLMNQTPT